MFVPRTSASKSHTLITLKVFPPSILISLSVLETVVVPVLRGRGRMVGPRGGARTRGVLVSYRVPRRGTGSLFEETLCFLWGVIPDLTRSLTGQDRKGIDSQVTRGTRISKS